MAQKPTVVHIHGFNPRSCLHIALSQIGELRNGYHFVTPKLSQASVFDLSWTTDPLKCFRLKPYWMAQPLYLVQPARIHIPEQAFNRVLESFAGNHNGTIYELVLKLGVDPRYKILEIINHYPIGNYL